MLSTISLETLGLINFFGISFLGELDQRLTDVSGDLHESFPMIQFTGGPALQFDSLQKDYA